MSNRQATADMRVLLRRLETAAWKCGTDEFSDGASEAGIRRRGNELDIARRDAEVAVDALLAERDRLREALDRIAESEHMLTPCASRFVMNDGTGFECDCPVSIARAALSGKGEGNG